MDGRWAVGTVVRLEEEEEEGDLPLSASEPIPGLDEGKAGSVSLSLSHNLCQLNSLT